MGIDNFESSKKELAQRIRNLPFFRTITLSVLDELEHALEYEELPENTVLIRQGQTCEALYIVLDGFLQTYATHPDHSDITLGRIWPGEPIGEVQILAGGCYSFSVKTMTRVLIAKLPKAAIDELLCKAPHLVERLADLTRRWLRHNQLANILQDVFGTLDHALLRDFEDRIEWVHIRGGEVLFKEGDPGDALYVVLWGRLRVAAQNGDHQEKIIGEVAMGESVGEMALFTREPRSATVSAIRDSELIKVSQAVFDSVIRRHPEVSLSISRILVNRLRSNIQHATPETSIKNIALIPITPQAPVDEIARQLAESLSAHGPALFLNSARIEAILQTPGITRASEDEIGNLRLLSWLNEQEMKHHYLIFAADKCASNWTLRCLRQADQVFLVADARDDCLSGAIDPSLINRHEATGTNARRALILVHGREERLPRNTRQWHSRWKVENHHHIRQGMADDIQRIARFITGTTTSLILSGGGARGLAHIGVIRALREAGIPIDKIGGASIGAIFAGAVAMDYSDKDIHRIARESFVERQPFREFTVPLLSLLRCRKLDGILYECFGQVRIEDLWIDYFCVSSNLSQAQLVIHREQSLTKAIRASIAYPGITVPVLDGEDLLVDGSVLNNLPVDIMRKDYRGRIIAADVSEEEGFKATGRKIPPPWLLLCQHLNPWQKKRFPNIIEIMFRTAVLSSINTKNQAAKEADLYLRPPVTHYKLMDFLAFDELVDTGYRYTQKALRDWMNTGG